LPLSRDPASVGEARRFVTQCCRDWGLEDPEDVTPLIVSELVTNALQHGEAPMTLFVGRRLDRLVVSVQDARRVDLAVEQAGDLSEHGRGLLLVQSLTRAWGQETLPDGKRVWAEVARPV
jgi:anti-sigma regulatory factor (Ser/Thr protein kinase)